MRTRVRLNPNLAEDIGQLPGMKDALREAGEAVAENIRALHIMVGDETPGVSFQIPLPVEVDEDSVTIAHPAGEAVQAKHGALTKGAAQAGMTVQVGRSSA